MNAYSTPAQPGTPGEPLIFDRTGDSNGSQLTHAANSPEIAVDEPGFYRVSFSGTIAPASGGGSPSSVVLFLQLNNTNVPGAASRSNFQSSNQTSTMSFTQIVKVSAVPSVFTVNNSGGPILYDTVSITVQKIK